MEWLDNLEGFFNDMVSMIQYGKIFAIVVCVAFLIVFAGLIIVNSNLHEVKEELREIKAMMKGEEKLNE